MALIECFIPPLLQPGPGNDAAWCVSALCNPCDGPVRRYADCDYIDISTRVKKTFIRMLTSVQYPTQVNPTRMNVYIEIRYRGSEAMIACYNAFQRTADGYLGFYWDSTFTDACPGLYVGDVYVECKYCFSIRFRVARCEMVVDSCYNEFAAEDCGLGECSMLETIGDGVVGGIECVVAPPVDECGLPAPYFDTTDPVVPIEATAGCNLSCTPAFSIAGDDIVGDI